MPTGLFYNATFDSNTKTLGFYDKAGNLIYSCVVDIAPPAPLVDDPTKPLYLLSKANGSTVRLAQAASATDVFEVSTDGTTWETATKNSDYTLDSGQGIYVRAQSQRTSFATSGTKMFRILMTGTIEAYHNVNSVLTPNFTSLTDLTTIGAHCLRGLFSRRLNDSTTDTALTKAPLFPATTLSESCYQHCFYGCQALAQCATISAITLAYRACRAMYYECTALTEAVLPPALLLSSNAYSNMFKGCTGLTSIREFPFTSLDLTGVGHCGEMFQGCINLTSSPELKPPTLCGGMSSTGCYYSMFYGCRSLAEVRISATDISRGGTYQWLTNVAATGDFYCVGGVEYPVDSPSGIPLGWTAHYNGMADNANLPLYLLSKQNGSTVQLRQSTGDNDVYQTSTDNVTWTNLTKNDTLTLNDGEGIYIRISADKTFHFDERSRSDSPCFTMSGVFEAYNNINSLLSPNFASLTDLTTVVSGGDHCLSYIFSTYQSGSSVRQDLALTKAPLLPATVLAPYCYRSMFDGCESLTQLPVLSASTMVDHCYRAMFANCTSITTPPELSSTSLAPYCYAYMFSSNTSLTQAPELPATTLADYCYTNMFYTCTSLTKGPELPAATLTDHCYYHMFYDAGVDEIRIWATDISATSCLSQWLDGVPATGDFYCVNGVNYPNGANGIPSGWTRLSIS